jgi:hypothetical protein
MPYVTPMVNVSLSLHPSLMQSNSVNKTKMLILHKEDHGCAYTLDEDNDLMYAPIYTDNTINLNEFAYVDMNEIDMDSMEVFDIQNELITASSNVQY